MTILPTLNSFPTVTSLLKPFGENLELCSTTKSELIRCPSTSKLRDNHVIDNHVIDNHVIDS